MEVIMELEGLSNFFLKTIDKIDFEKLNKNFSNIKESVLILSSEAYMCVGELFAQIFNWKNGCVAQSELYDAIQSRSLKTFKNILIIDDNFDSNFLQEKLANQNVIFFSDFYRCAKIEAVNRQFMINKLLPDVLSCLCIALMYYVGDKDQAYHIMEEMSTFEIDKIPSGKGYHFIYNPSFKSGLILLQYLTKNFGIPMRATNILSIAENGLVLKDEFYIVNQSKDIKSSYALENIFENSKFKGNYILLETIYKDESINSICSLLSALEIFRKIYTKEGK